MLKNEKFDFFPTVLTNAKKYFRLAIFYRKIGRKMTFYFEDPGIPAERTWEDSLSLR